MDTYAEIDAICQKIGRDDERLRIFKAVAEMPLSPCECDREWLVLGMHDAACLFNAEIGYRTRVLSAIAPTPESRSEGSHRGGGTTSDLLSAAAAGDGL